MHGSREFVDDLEFRRMNGWKEVRKFGLVDARKY
jgi:hypothetical protein